MRSCFDIIIKIVYVQDTLWKYLTDSCIIQIAVFILNIGHYGMLGSMGGCNIRIYAETPHNDPQSCGIIS